MRFLVIIKVEMHEWQRYVPVNALVMVVLIAEDTGVSLVCNLL